MFQLFNAYAVAGNSDIPAYFIESTATDNIDDAAEIVETPPGTERLNPDQAIGNIVDHLAKSLHPNLVIAVHGFNSPRLAVLGSYGRSFEALEQDKEIIARGAVCIGYRWPSERIKAPIGTILAAAPLSFGVLLFLGFILFCAGVAINVLASNLVHILPAFHLGKFLQLAISLLATIAVIFGTIVFFSPLALAVLRIVVYFRDGYRAITYGVPDLVDIIRQIDAKLKEVDKRRNHVELSFMGHSMGAYVVTNVVRILSDVFSPSSVRRNLATLGPIQEVNAPEQERVSPNIGHVFRLARLVLISPDIPAETLMSGRANFLASSLTRFKEAFLFSSEGDEVLRQISTIANYFSFPTRTRKFGYRLGNVGVIADGYGVSKGVDLTKLRLGPLPLDALNALLGAESPQTSLAGHFSYFDCTDGVDDGKGVVTFAKPGQNNDLGPFEHFMLLFNYLRGRDPDVHSGYFSADFFKQLIYRLACMGYSKTQAAYGGDEKLSAACKSHQIKAQVHSHYYRIVQQGEARIQASQP